MNLFNKLARFFGKLSTASMEVADRENVYVTLKAEKHISREDQLAIKLAVLEGIKENLSSSELLNKVQSDTGLFYKFGIKRDKNEVEITF